MKKYLFLLLLLPTIISAQQYSLPGKTRIDTAYIRGSIRFIPNEDIPQIDTGMVFRATATGEFLPSKLKPWDLGIGGNAAADSDFVLRRNGKWESASSSIVWGTITGTLSSQTDLQNALNAKLNLSGGNITGAINTVGNINLTASDNLIQNTTGDLEFKAASNFNFGYGQTNNINVWNGTNTAITLGYDGYVNAVTGYKINGTAINFGSFLTSEADGSDTNELQNLTYTESTKALQISAGNTVTISGFLTAEVDGSTTNEIQVLSYDAVNNSIRLSSGGGQVVMDGWATAGHTHSSITQELDLGTLTLVFTNGILTGYY